MPKVISDERKELLGTLNTTRQNQKPEPAGTDVSQVVQAQCPEHMTENAFRIYLATTEYLNGIQLLRPEDLPLIEVYASRLAEYREVQQDVHKLKRKYTKAHFAREVMLRGMIKDVLALAKEIGIGPAFRSKYKLSQGDLPGEEKKKDGELNLN